MYLEDLPTKSGTVRRRSKTLVYVLMPEDGKTMLNMGNLKIAVIKNAQVALHFNRFIVSALEGGATKN